MRKILLMALLASAVAMPAVAQDQARGRWQRNQDGQSAASDNNANRPARAERAERAERPERAAQPEQVERVRAERPERAMAAPTDVAREQSGWSQRVRARRSDNGVATPVEVRRDQRSGQSFAERLAAHRRARGEAVTNSDGARTTTPTTSTISPRRAETVRKWTNTHWRNDRRYDWRSYRDHHHSIFRYGNYYDPYRSSYRRFSIGFNLWPSYYQSNYWLNDPWMYRLPPVYGPYRWVRYYDDALLVNIFTGEVEDVVRDFFW